MNFYKEFKYTPEDLTAKSIDEYNFRYEPKVYDNCPYDPNLKHEKNCGDSRLCNYCDRYNGISYEVEPNQLKNLLNTELTILHEEISTESTIVGGEFDTALKRIEIIKELIDKLD